MAKAISRTKAVVARTKKAFQASPEIETYGRLKEGVYITGFTFERACSHLEWLLADDNRWRVCGNFSDVNQFMESIKLDQLRSTIEQRKRIATRIKALQPKASNRKIAKMLGVSPATVDRDIASDEARGSKKVNENKQLEKRDASNGAPQLSGAEAARVVGRAERVAGRQQNVNDRVARVSLDARKFNKFSLILADPPWDDEFGASTRSIENHYPTMRFEDILSLPVSDIAYKQAMLFLWATPSMLEMAFTTVRAWGFEYRTQMIWVKPSIGLGKYVRQRHELLLICRRGDHPAPAAETLSDSVIEAARSEHSAKPEIFHEIIERMYPDAERIELFRRGIPRVGWQAWGAETQQPELKQIEAAQ